jgi:hypothetical protein
MTIFDPAMPMRSSRSRHCLAACLLAALFVLPAAHADDDDTINPDRPDVTESSQVVGKGRVQLETGLNWDRRRDPDAHERTLTMPTVLRIGLSGTFELSVATDGRTIVHASDPTTGAHTTSADWADLTAGVKWHAADQDGARPSLGVIANVLLPTGSRALRGAGFRPMVAVPAEWDLGHDWSLALMPGIGRDSDDGGSRYTYGVLAASVTRAFGERLHGFAEVAAPQIARAAHGGTQLQADAGVSWLVNKDCQVDAMVVRGLHRNTPELSLAVGISVRR